jgi:dephospho-CoA kinase
MIKIAITGNIGTGKSTITKIVKELGFKVFDSDQEVEYAMSEKDLIKQISKEFKPKVQGLIKGNRIDKLKLGEFVFSNPKELKKLEQMIHPKVWENKKKFLETHRSELLVFLDIPLLFEKKLQNNFDFIIRTYVSPKIQKERVLKRKNMTQEKFNQIIKAQIINTEVEDKCVSLNLNTEEDIETLKIKVKNFVAKVLNSEKAAD